MIWLVKSIKGNHAKNSEGSNLWSPDNLTFTKTLTNSLTNSSCTNSKNFTTSILVMCRRQLSIWKWFYLIFTSQSYDGSLSLQFFSISSFLYLFMVLAFFAISFFTPFSAQISANKFQNLSQIPLKNCGVWLKHHDFSVVFGSNTTPIVVLLTNILLPRGEILNSVFKHHGKFENSFFVVFEPNTKSHLSAEWCLH